MAVTEKARDEKYVRDGGAGANDGTSFADAWDLTQVAGNQAANRRFNLAGGAYAALAGSLTWSTQFAANTPQTFQGWNAAMTGLATFDDMPIIDGNNAQTLSVAFGSYYNGIRFTQCTAIGGSSTDLATFDFCEIDNSTGLAVNMDNYNTFMRCRIHDCPSVFNLDIGCKIISCEVYDISGAAVSSLSSASTLWGSVFSRCGTAIIGLTGAEVMFCTIDDCTTAFNLAAYSSIPVIGCQVTNNGTAFSATADDGFVVEKSNFFGNTTDGSVHTLIDQFNLNPQYADAANNDWTVGNASLKNIEFPPMGGTMHIGAIQGGGGGGGGGGLPIFGPSGITR